MFNEAKQGGVFFASNGVEIKIKNGYFESNKAQEGSILFAIYN